MHLNNRYSLILLYVLSQLNQQPVQHGLCPFSKPRNGRDPTIHFSYCKCKGQFKFSYQSPRQKLNVCKKQKHLKLFKQFKSELFLSEHILHV